MLCEQTKFASPRQSRWCQKWTDGGYTETRGGEYNTLCNQQFNRTRAGTEFELKRPAFQSGMPYVLREAGSIKNINQRHGLGNYEMKRPAFMSPDIKPRQVIDFDKLQALDIEQAGQKVQLGESTLKKMFEVAVPDSTDTKWLEEKARLTALYRRQGMTPEQITKELEVNKPLGREQRTTTEKRNIGTSNLSMADKLKEIKEEVDAGNAQSRAQQAILTGQLAVILNNTNAINALTQQQLQDLGQSLARIGVPTNHKRLGLIPRYVDNNYYLANAGMINLLLFSKVRETPNTNQYNYDLLVKNFVANANGLPAIRLTTMISGLRENRQGGVRRRYLDLERGGVISRAHLRDAANNDPQGFNSPEFAINPGNQ